MNLVGAGAIDRGRAGAPAKRVAAKTGDKLEHLREIASVHRGVAHDFAAKVGGLGDGVVSRTMPAASTSTVVEELESGRTTGRV
jgi:hypothetical protein